jgi:acetyl esterase/lipase
MLHTIIDIPVGEYTAKLYTYILDNPPDIGITKRPCVLLCPGGAYFMIANGEAEPVAMRFLAKGINVCILRYSVASVAPVRFPVALEQVARSIVLLRDHAEEWGIEVDKIAVLGFSAGGHLAASMGMFWNREFLAERMGMENERFRPNGLILCYSVITSGEFGHDFSFECLLGDKAKDPAIRAEMSLENAVSADTPPVFLWHTWTDEAVPVENALLLMSALRRQNIPLEAHIYPNGHHGLSLGTTETGPCLYPEMSGWIELAIAWVKRL